MSETSSERDKRHVLERQTVRALYAEYAKDPEGVMLALLDLVGLLQDGIHASERERAELRNLLLPDEAKQKESQFIESKKRQQRWFEGVDWIKTTVAGLVIGALFTALVSLVQCGEPGRKIPTPIKVQTSDKSRSKSASNR